MPEIPAVGGQILQRFGQQLQNFGNTVANLGLAADQSAKALYNGVVTQELTAAKRMFADQINEYNYAIESGTNTDYRAYVPAWDASIEKMRETAVSRMSTQEAKDKFEEWLVAASQTNAEWLRKRAAYGLVADAEATALTTIETWARHGSEEGVMDSVRDNVRGGVWTGEEGSTYAAKYIPIARYNNIENTLDALDDPETAIRMLMDKDADERFQLPATGEGLTIETMRKHFESELGSRTAQAERLAEANGLKAHTEATKKWIDTPDTFSREEIWGLAARVNKDNQSLWRDRAATWEKVYRKDLESVEAAKQDERVNRWLETLYTAAEAGTELPVKGADAIELMLGDQYDSASVTRMKTAYAGVVENRQARTAAGFYRDIRTAEIAGTDPTKLVPQSKVDETYFDTKEMTFAEYKAVTAELVSAREKFLTRAQRDDPDAESAIYQQYFGTLAPNKTFSNWVTDTKHMIDDKEAKGLLTPGTAKSWREGVDIFERIPGLKQIFADVRNVFETEMRLKDTPTTEELNKITNSMNAALDRFLDNARNFKGTDEQLIEKMEAERDLFTSQKNDQNTQNNLAAALGSANPQLARGFPANTGAAAQPWVRTISLVAADEMQKLPASLTKELTEKISMKRDLDQEVFKNIGVKIPVLKENTNEVTLTESTYVNGMDFKGETIYAAEPITYRNGAIANKDIYIVRYRKVSDPVSQNEMLWPEVYKLGLREVPTGTPKAAVSSGRSFIPDWLLFERWKEP